MRPRTNPRTSGRDARTRISATTAAIRTISAGPKSRDAVWSRSPIARSSAAEGARCELRVRRQWQVPGRIAGRDAIGPAGDPPLAGNRIEPREEPRVGLDRHALRSAGLKLDTLEPEQTHA